MPLKSVFIAAFLCFFSFLAAAQSSASIDNSTSELDLSELTSFNEDEWTFYLDAENKVYYIDFETIKVNLSDVQVKDAKGEVVLQDKLWDLPVNTIYELNFNDFRAGTYQVELRTYTGKITKEVQITD